MSPTLFESREVFDLSFNDCIPVSDEYISNTFGHRDETRSQNWGFMSGTRNMTADNSALVKIKFRDREIFPDCGVRNAYRKARIMLKYVQNFKSIVHY